MEFFGERELQEQVLNLLPAAQTNNQLHRHDEVSVREANMRSLPQPLARKIAVGRTKDACRSCSHRQVIIALLHFWTRPLTSDNP